MIISGQYGRPLLSSGKRQRATHAKILHSPTAISHHSLAAKHEMRSYRYLQHTGKLACKRRQQARAVNLLSQKRAESPEMLQLGRLRGSVARFRPCL
jgi:hypothetical protein